MHFSASCSLTQPLLDCILYLTLIRYPYDPGTLASSANRCVLGKVYLRSTYQANSRHKTCACSTVAYGADAIGQLPPIGDRLPQRTEFTAAVPQNSEFGLSTVTQDRELRSVQLSSIPCDIDTVVSEKAATELDL